MIIPPKNSRLSRTNILSMKSTICWIAVISAEQDTVDYLAKKDAQLSIQGRHDPCIVPRAAIVQSCAAALAVGDLLTARYGEAWMTHPTSFRKEDE